MIKSFVFVLALLLNNGTVQVTTPTFETKEQCQEALRGLLRTASEDKNIINSYVIPCNQLPISPEDLAALNKDKA